MDTGTVTVSVDPVNDAPVAVDDSATTSDGTSATGNVLDNDSDVDEDTLTAALATYPTGGTVILNPDGSFTYTPYPGTTTDSFDYSVSDHNGGTDTATVSITESSGTALYVYDIRFESKRGNKDWRAVFEIRSDSDADGNGTAADDVAAGVWIRVEFDGVIYEGTTDADGVFRTSWIRGLGSGDHQAQVIDLVLADFDWNPLTLDLEGDSDGDGLPDEVLSL
jgi:hypothetical protein